MTTESQHHLPILYVDDDPIAHKIMTKYLDGWNLHHAYSAEEAMEKISDLNIQIIITDIYMEDMDGIELTKTIKKDQATAQIIVVTGISETIHLINALDAGASDFLLKPIKKDKLIETLKYTEIKIKRWKDTLKNIFSLKHET